MPNNRQENQKTDLKLKLLQSDPFDVDLYVKSMIGNLGTSDEVLAFGTSLCDARDDAGNEIRKNVYKNYQDFVIIGGEITKLESDMLSFRGLLRELFDVSESFRNFNNKGAVVVLIQRRRTGNPVRLKIKGEVSRHKYGKESCWNGPN